MATNADFNSLIARITTATNTLETDVVAINAGASNITEQVEAAEQAASQAQASQASATASASTATTQANAASSAATTATNEANRAQAIANDLLASAPFQEAPEDGNVYGRKDGGWSVVTGGGAVDSVNGQTGVVVLTAADVGAKPSSYVPTWSEVTGKPSTFAPSAHVHSASDVTSGTFDVARIPDLAASKVTTGTFDAARIPTLDAAKIGTGVVAPARLGTGTPTASTVLFGNGTWGSVPAPAGGFPISETINYNGAAMTNWPFANPNQAANGNLLVKDALTGIIAIIQGGSSGQVQSIPCGKYWFNTALKSTSAPAGGQVPAGSETGYIEVTNAPNATTKMFVAYIYDQFAAPDLGKVFIWHGAGAGGYWTRVGKS